MLKKYKGKLIQVEDKESLYFSSSWTYPKSKAVEYAIKEKKKNPILNRYEIKRRKFPPTSAYPKGINYEIVFYYHRPLNQYYDYGTDLKEAKKDLIVFEKNKNTPLFPYAVSSVERNMFRASINAALETVKATAQKKKKILSIFDHRNKITKYTNWSGD